jgi:glycosyltransferase involved in cell wall biosynthesis
MPKVIHVVRKFEPREWGGVETHLVELIPELAKRGWQSEVHAPAEAGTDGAAIVAAGAEFKQFRAQYPILGLDRAGRAARVASGGNLVAAGELLELARRRDATLMHAHTLRRLGGVVRTAARIREIPYAVTIHGPVRTAPSSLAPTSGRRTFDLGAPFGWAVGARRVVEDADLVFALNADEHRAWESARAGRHLSKMKLGVRTTRATPEARRTARAMLRESHGVPLDAQFAVVVARLDHVKGQDLAIEAFLASAPSSMHLVLVGAPMTEAYAARVRALASRDPARLHVLGGVVPETARALLAEATIALVPSRAEAFGLVLLEAWAEGTPAIACAVGGLRDIARHGDAARTLVPPDDAKELGNRLAECLADPSWRALESALGPARVATAFGWGKVADEIVAAYERACGRRAA